MREIYFMLLGLIFLSACQEQNVTNVQQDVIQGPTGNLLDSLLTPYVEILRARTNNEGGLAIGVVKGDDIVYAKTFGYADMDRGSKVDLNTKFHIASLSKPFVAAAVLKLREMGKVDLDDPIGKHLPELEETNSPFAPVTIKQILTHTSGIPRHISVDDWRNPVIGDDALEKNLMELADFELDFEPGAKYSYSNAAFDVLGLVVSRISGQSYFDFVEQALFLPAGMNGTTFRKPGSELPKDWANSHSFGLQDQVLTPYPYNLKIAPSSGVKSSILDMCQWARMHLGKGKVDGQEVLSEESFSSLVSPQAKTPWGDDIGLSWYLQQYLDRPIIMHTGESHGFESMFYIYPEEEISIIILANRSFSRAGRIVNAVSEVLFDSPLKAYQVSGVYKYADLYKAQGLEKANQAWEEMRTDTTDIYFIDDYDLLTSADILDNGQQGQASKDLLELFMEHNANSTYAWRLYGNAHLNLGDTTNAIIACEKTLEINPNYEKGRNALEQLVGQRN
ncbi:MAG: serine hydrolase [Bacteroidota bacterium]